MELYTEGEVVVKFMGGNLVAIADTKGLKSENTLKIDYLFGKIKEAIPGTVDDSVLDLISAALKSL